MLPGIGSSDWLAACRRDLGLTLPSEPTQVVATQASEELQWDENQILLSAYLSGAERLMDVAEVDDEAAFQFCMGLTEFPLFPDELHTVAKKTHEVLATFGVPCSVDLCDAAQVFFADSGTEVLSERLNDEVLSDSFWRSPGNCRPDPFGEWTVIRCPSEGLQLDSRCCERIVLDEAWHGGDWPSGCLVPAHEQHLLHSNAALLLRHLLSGLTSTWRWIRAPQSFWDSAFSTPFARFHLLQVN